MPDRASIIEVNLGAASIQAWINQPGLRTRVGSEWASERDRQAEVIILTLSSFIEHEEHESQSVAERFIDGLRSQNLAAVGLQATLEALRWNKVDTLVMARDYQPDPLWTCTACRAIRTEPPETSLCPNCSEPSMRPLDVKEALLSFASQLECPVEVVEQADELMSLGGVGCLLRYRSDPCNDEPVYLTQFKSTHTTRHPMSAICDSEGRRFCGALESLRQVDTAFGRHCYQFQLGMCGK